MCRADDFPPYEPVTHGSLPVAPDGPVADSSYNGWKTRATWSAWNWLSGDEMLFRLARARIRERGTAGAVASEILSGYGGPLARREIELAGGFDAIDFPELAAALVELFDGDDRL
jgi:hypothetical protein